VLALGAALSIAGPVLRLIFAVLAAVAAGIIIGGPTLRLRSDYLAIVTLGFGEIIRVFLNNLNRPYNITNGPQGITLIDPLQIDGHSLSKTYDIAGLIIAPVHSYYFVFLLCALAAVLISRRLEDSRIGRAWIAIREDELAAASMGINTRNVKLLAFAMGATFGGVAGGLFASFQGFISPESFTLLDSVMVLCMVVLGGMGNVAGVVLGALLLTALPEALRYAAPLQQQLFGAVYIDPSDLRMLLFGLALVLMMLFRPAGILPSATRRRELAAPEDTAALETPRG
jgi:branched-chain amino acid transport system permease protein